jgi:hypothetical protein
MPTLNSFTAPRSGAFTARLVIRPRLTACSMHSQAAIQNKGLAESADCRTGAVKSYLIAIFSTTDLNQPAEVGLTNTLFNQGIKVYGD